MGSNFRVKVLNRGWQHQLLLKGKGVSELCGSSFFLLLL